MPIRASASLTTRARSSCRRAEIRTRKADPRLGRAEALRNAMLAYLNDRSSLRNAYPAYWAPFPSSETGPPEAID